MNNRNRLALLAFIIPASLSTWGAMVLISALFVSLNPMINYAGSPVIPAICMVFFGLLAIVYFSAQ